MLIFNDFLKRSESLWKKCKIHAFLLRFKKKFNQNHEVKWIATQKENKQRQIQSNKKNLNLMKTIASLTVAISLTDSCCFCS